MIDVKLLLEIVLVFAKIDLLSFGGGYVAIPIVQKEIVEVQHWMSNAEFSDILAIDELTPGPVAINCATFVGNKMAGAIGGIAATFGCILPSVIISIILFKVYAKYHGLSSLDGILGGLRSMVLGLIASVALTLLKNAILPNMNFNLLAFILFLISLYILRKYKPDPIYVILGCGFISLIINLIIL